MASHKAFVVLALGALGIAACDGGNGDDARDREPATRTTRGITDTEVRVAGVGDLAIDQDSLLGAQARFARANAEGGVHGRAINLVAFEDDASDPVRNEAAVTKLVHQDQVFAVVPAASTSPAGIELLEAARVPFFGLGSEAGFCANEVGFGLTGCLVPSAPGAASNAWGLVVREHLGGDVDGTTAAVVGDDTDAGRAGVGGTAAGATDVGFDVVYAEAAVPEPVAEQPPIDHTATASEVLASDEGAAPDVVFLTNGFANVQGLTVKLQELGFVGVLTTAVGYDPRLVEMMARPLVFTPLAPFEGTAENPVLQQLAADVKAVRPDQALTPLLAAGYFAADLFLEALERTGRDLTVERFLTAANDDFDWGYEDTVGPITFPDAHEQPSPCGALVQSDGSQFAVLVSYTCGEVIGADDPG